MRIYHLFLTLDYACLLMEWSWGEVDSSIKRANFKQRTWVGSENSRSIKGLEICAGFLTCPPYSSFLTFLPLRSQVCDCSLEFGWDCDCFDQWGAIWLPKLNQKRSCKQSSYCIQSPWTSEMGNVLSAPKVEKTAWWQGFSTPDVVESKSPHSFIHIFAEHLLCARHCAWS